MGSILSRRIAGVEDIDIQANSAYRYPPKSGNYFASHFFMGGEKFDTPHPEGYLFGENMDLNFLGNRPVQFPYVTPAPQEPVKTLRSLVNIRKDSLRLARYKDDADSPTDEGTKPRALYGVEFTFDSDARVAITIYCQAFEEFSNGMAIYNPKTPALVSETVYYKRGVSQQFTLPSFKMDFSEWKEEDLNFDLDRGVFPMVIQAVVDEGDDCLGHAHVLLAAFERHVDGSFSVKPLKQKQIVDRVSYLLQEIYGIENKNNQETKEEDEEKLSEMSDAQAHMLLHNHRIVFVLVGLISASSLVLTVCVCSTLRSPSSPIQEEDEEKLSEMSDAQAHMLLSSSPAPTEGTAGEDAPDSLSPEDGE
ncbi:E3 ubiquitin-protein ligase MGRN1-like [Sinocyclocheilus grahami]|uniref:E3 ubiquitin-protein ligase MGRN1-like n=1 Tax=Sinocyclocheilus grahami TaxID=75366 RepID=UPI0007AD18EA|nr:PREDICTED: E3 ubiquitin-protein ligase MGRN1-like [Sinocyclocheilus grahami]